MSLNSDPHASSAFERLHPTIQRWIWRQKWPSLREVQERAIPHVLRGDCDVVISATTAAGKTEAAFLPLATRILEQPTAQAGFQVLVISPLKALINDQHERLRDLLGSGDIPVHRRHGDVSQSERNRAVRKPDGVLLITPESLEALFINRGHQIPSLFAPLRAMVVDELHAFIGVERGMQLQSLMHRLEMALRRRAPRLGLSATLGDMQMAAEALRPDGGFPQELVLAEGGGQCIRLKLYGVENREAHDEEDGEEGLKSNDDNDRHPLNGDIAVAHMLFQTLRGDSHLIFANARNRVELYSERLRRMCDHHRVPNEFWPHHGSLSKALREDTERALKDSSRPATAICTSTLEMGIDIGKVRSVAQLGSPPSVAALRQRLGRSGRRGEAPQLRLYVQEPPLTEKPAITDQLRQHLFQTTAMVTLMGRRWIEPLESQRPHLSTLVQQLLSVVAQWGEISAADCFSLLCENGPFHRIKIAQFKQLLRDLADKKMLRQTQDLKLILDRDGEQLVNHYSFYAAFQSPKTFRLMHQGKTLGELPVDSPLVEKQGLVFAGLRWLVKHVDTENLIIHLTPAQGGTPPLFGGGGAEVHAQVRLEMRDLYMGTIIPPFLDEQGKRLFQQGQETFSSHHLHHTALLASGKDLLLFPWLGDATMFTFIAWLTRHDVEASQEWSAIRVSDITMDDMGDLLSRMVANGPPDPQVLARDVREKRTEKHHPLLSDGLLAWEWAEGGRFDPHGAWEAASSMSDNTHRQ
ncbi:MAG: DEAD/DEAH box helicase [Magnetococcales bacterium]|nr:DEAD/DEAH box helicase [Magnetococcales bacterium]